MLTYEILSSSGEREYNEDYAKAAWNNGAYCFVLADGLGGHGGGAEASKLVAEHIIGDFKENGEVSEDYLKKCFEESQDTLLKEQERTNRIFEMKTTLVILLADEHTFRWGHIGDSRLYYFKDRKLVQRTFDHSVPQMLVAAGEIDEGQIRGHADRNRLLRVMGTEWESPRYQLAEHRERTKNEAFLLCTDGFWEWVLEKEMQAFLKRAKTPGEWLKKMEREIKKNGLGKGMDNYTAIAVYME